MGFIDWYREWTRKAREERERKKAQRELELRQRREAELREQQRLEEMESQRRHQQENILTILNDDKLPKIDWRPLGQLPFKFQKTEHLIYVFPQVGYAEQRVKREIVGRSAGTSVRVMKGVSIRAGASRGTPVERDEIVSRGVGTMAVTNRHLYFNGQRSFRIRFDKIVSVEPMADAVGVTRDRASALSEYFVVGRRDAQFAYELLTMIPSLELPREPETEAPEYGLLMLPGDMGDYTFEEG